MKQRLRIVIVEDEPAIARDMGRMLRQIDADINLVQTLTSVYDAIAWFKANSDAYDIIFMDIRLSDGQSFEIFKQVSIERPVVFVTSYHQHAIEAFKNNGLDYLLKPFDELELKNALQKYSNWIKPGADNSATQINNLFKHLTTTYKRSFLVHYRNKLIPVETTQITCFYTTDEVVYAHTQDGRRMVIEHTMEALSQMLDPDQFYRANRQFIIQREAVTEVEFFFNGRLLVKVTPEPPEKIVISKAKVADFKNWMNR